MKRWTHTRRYWIRQATRFADEAARLSFQSAGWQMATEKAERERDEARREATQLRDRLATAEWQLERACAEEDRLRREVEAHEKRTRVRLPGRPGERADAVRRPGVVADGAAGRR